MANDEPRYLPMAQPVRSAALPVFEKVAIVGLGLVGGSLALGCRNTWPSSLVIGVDENEVLEQAMVRQVIDVGARDLAIVAGADLVVLAAPAAVNAQALARLDEVLDGPAVVTDVSGTTRALDDAIRRLPPRFVFIGGHPLAGGPQAGLERARPELFEGRPWLLTPGGPDEVVGRVAAFITALGARPVLMRDDERERLVAFIVELPRLVAGALLHAAGDNAGEPGLALTGRAFADLTRLAATPADRWADVLTANRESATAALDALVGALGELRASLGAREQAERWCASANGWRERLSALTSVKG